MKKPIIKFKIYKFKDREKRREMIKSLRTTLADKYRSLPASKSTGDKSN